MSSCIRCRLMRRLVRLSEHFYSLLDTIHGWHLYYCKAQHVPAILLLFRHDMLVREACNGSDKFDHLYRRRDPFLLGNDVCTGSHWHVHNRLDPPVQFKKKNNIKIIFLKGICINLITITSLLQKLFRLTTFFMFLKYLLYKRFRSSN